MLSIDISIFFGNQENMMKLKSSGKKSKLPKIEIKECKGKTKDEKKLENEMFKQAREAKVLLDQLLDDGKFSSTHTSICYSKQYNAFN